MTGPEIDTANGRVRGHLSHDVAVFRGIPFAAPPVGPRRWAPPVPPEPWIGVLEADSAGATAPQNPSLLEQMLGAGDAVVAEDCLHLNVFTAASLDAGERRPVMVWIHGGGFLTGTGSIPWYDGHHLATRGVVVVTINYRLGVLGFLHLEDIAPGFTGSGNLGILDQVAALAWVRENISAFGGDPDNVTIFGESAGAMSVGTLLAVPAAEGLFHRAILESGAAAQVHTAEAATAAASKYLAELGVEPADLRDVPLDEILAAQARYTANIPFDAGLPLQPVIDGTVLPSDPLQRIAAGSAAGVDVLVGTNTEEMKMFLLMEPELAQLDEAALGARADAIFVPKGRAPGEAVAIYRGARPGEPVAEVLSAMLTDHTFRIPAIQLAEAQLAHHPGVWMYLFGYRSPSFGGALGACHALEIPFVWDNLDAQGAAMFAGEITDAMRHLSATLADLWVAFARDGVPSADGVASWPRYDLEHRTTIRFDVDSIDLVDDPHPAERELWTSSTVVATRDWLVGGGIIEDPLGVLLVQNRRRNGSVDWSPPGGVIDAGETLVEGLTREVLEETGLSVTEWDGPVYEIVAEAPDLGWRLRVEAFRAVRFTGEVTIDDPDGIVVDACFTPSDGCRGRLAEAPRWVREPLTDWLAARWQGSRAYGYRVDGTDLRSLAVTRL